MTWGATMVVPQSFEWHISIDKSATSMNYGILLQGFGGILAVPLIEAYGRSASPSSFPNPLTDMSQSPHVVLDAGHHHGHDHRLRLL